LRRFEGSGQFGHFAIDIEMLGKRPAGAKVTIAVVV